MQKYRYQSIRNGLVGHWRPSRGPTGNTLIDSVQGNHGTLTNGPTWQASGNGYAISFDGTNDYVAINNLIRSLSVNVSISTWFLNRGNFTGYQALFDCGNAGSSRQLSCFLGGTSSELYVAIRSPAGGAAISLVSAMSLNVWTHLVLAYNGTTTTAFLNGIASGSSTAVSGVSYTDFEFRIGGNPSGGGAAFNGLQDDTAIWNRTVSSSEVLALYTAGRGALDQRVNVPVVRGATVASGISGSANQTELDDTSTGTGSLSLNATVSQTELDDIVTQTATTTISGSASQTEVADTVSQTASLTITGTANQTELDDISSESGTILISAVVNQLELDDLVNQEGTVGNTNYASANQLEIDDTSTSAGSLTIQGRTYTVIGFFGGNPIFVERQLELPDTQTVSASLTIQASVSQTELSDISVATATTTIRASVLQTELNDITLATGTQEEQSDIPRLTITSFTESTKATLSITRTSAVLVITSTKQT